ncbi:hypothetical protein BU16DRAFT_563039 [Lophium mytilinum]|uniref:Uncharacterized protein n=1 Tax=Lophium mytilinum TaxID=390894 RepID=A0A6A6QQT4_9PEZI|nr:hypothetical protein BU16DRAFT_563039 [Lophium mytilinum]
MPNLSNIITCIATAFRAVSERHPPRLETIERAIKASAMFNTAKAEAKAVAKAARKAEGDAVYKAWMEHLRRNAGNLDPRNSPHQRFGPPW